MEIGYKWISLKYCLKNIYIQNTYDGLHELHPKRHWIAWQRDKITPQQPPHLSGKARFVLDLLFEIDHFILGIGLAVHLLDVVKKQIFVRTIIETIAYLLFRKIFCFKLKNFIKYWNFRKKERSNPLTSIRRILFSLSAGMTANVFI